MVNILQADPGNHKDGLMQIQRCTLAYLFLESISIMANIGLSGSFLMGAMRAGVIQVAMPWALKARGLDESDGRGSVIARHFSDEPQKSRDV